MEIVDTLVDDFDVIEVLTRLTSRCVDLLEVAAAGILLADEHGQLRVIGASTDAVQVLELFQIQNDEGPCLDCCATGGVVSNHQTSARSMGLLGGGRRPPAGSRSGANKDPGSFWIWNSSRTCTASGPRRSPAAAVLVSKRECPQVRQVNASQYQAGEYLDDIEVVDKGVDNLHEGVPPKRAG